MAATAFGGLSVPPPEDNMEVTSPARRPANEYDYDDDIDIIDFDEYQDDSIQIEEDSHMLESDEQPLLDVPTDDIMDDDGGVSIIVQDSPPTVEHEMVDSPPVDEEFTLDQDDELLDYGDEHAVQQSEQEEVVLEASESVLLQSNEVNEANVSNALQEEAAEFNEVDQSTAEPAEFNEGEQSTVEPAVFNEGDQSTVEPAELHDGDQPKVEPAEDLEAQSSPPAAHDAERDLPHDSQLPPELDEDEEELKARTQLPPELEELDEGENDDHSLYVTADNTQQVQQAEDNADDALQAKAPEAVAAKAPSPQDSGAAGLTIDASTTEQFNDGPDTPTDTGLHPMTVDYGDMHLPLFKSRNQPDGLLKDDNLASLSLAELMQNCRERLGKKLGEQVPPNHDIELSFNQLGLKLVEDTRPAFESSLNDVLEVYLQLHHNDNDYDVPPLALSLSLCMKFQSSFDTLRRAAAAGEGMSSFVLLTATELEDIVSHKDASENVHQYDGQADELNTYQDDDQADDQYDETTYVEGLKDEEPEDENEDEINQRDDASVTEAGDSTESQHYQQGYEEPSAVQHEDREPDEQTTDTDLHHQASAEADSDLNGQASATSEQAEIPGGNADATQDDQLQESNGHDDEAADNAQNDGLDEYEAVDFTETNYADADYHGDEVDELIDPEDDFDPVDNLQPTSKDAAPSPKPALAPTPGSPLGKRSYEEHADDDVTDDDEPEAKKSRPA